jgi:Cyclic nucleotide-binding domain
MMTRFLQQYCAEFGSDVRVDETTVDIENSVRLTRFVPSDSPSEKLAPEVLWQRLSGLEIFRNFSDEQRDSFLSACEHEPAIRLCRFTPGAVVCRKGEYELDLCFILSGSVELLDEVDGQRTRVATLGAGRFYGELGALGGLPRTLDIVALEETEIFYVPRHALKYLEINPQARALVGDRYREMAVRVTVADIELFRGVAPDFIDELIPKCEIQRYELRGVPLVTQGGAGRRVLYCPRRLRTSSARARGWDQACLGISARG